MHYPDLKLIQLLLFLLVLVATTTTDEERAWRWIEVKNQLIKFTIIDISYHYMDRLNEGYFYLVFNLYIVIWNFKLN